MKKLFLFTMVLFLGVFNAYSQDNLEAFYPLQANGNDTTEQNGEMIIYYAPFQNGGIYSNGIYNGGSEEGSHIRTPYIGNLDVDNFSVLLDVAKSQGLDDFEDLLYFANCMESELSKKRVKNKATKKGK